MHNVCYSLLLFFLNYLFIYLFLAVLGLRFCAMAFSSCGKWGPLPITVRGPLTIAALLLRSTSSRRAGSVTVAHGPSRSAACGILPDQGPNPRPPHRQADSQPLRHQGSPSLLLLMELMLSIVATNIKWKRSDKRFNAHKNKPATQVIHNYYQYRPQKVMHWELKKKTLCDVISKSHLNRRLIRLFYTVSSK